MSPRYGGDEGHELKAGVTVRCPEGVCTPLATDWDSADWRGAANGDDETGEFNVHGELGEPCFLLK